MDMNEFQFKRVAIVGVGLIGGSLALAMKKRKIAEEVVGIFRRPSSADKALSKGLVDKAKIYPNGLRDCDLVILCTPISAIIEQLGFLAKYVNPNAIVTDVGSSKALIMEAARESFDKKRPDTSPKFVGCHPMAGLEKTGFEYSDADLFNGALCFVTEKNDKVLNLWKSLGCNVRIQDPEAHDFWVAQISHLPHLISFALFKRFQFLGDIPTTNPSIQEFARLSKSDPRIWTDVIISNKKEILEALIQFSQSLNEWKVALEAGNDAKIYKMISDANQLSFEKLIFKTITTSKQIEEK